MLLGLFLALSYMTAISVLVRRRTRQLRHALEERARIEDEVVQARQHIANLERTGIVGQMSTIIAHELKQPLGAITNYGNGLLRRLRRGRIDPKSFETALSEVVLQAERASQIVERVRAYAKHDFPPRTVAD
ncbi:ATPase/histidine kinase/DNA gyrase B/HSP90 domain protein, partial [gut metagenome]